MIIKAARPDIKDNSIKQYMSSLRTLNDGKPIMDVDFLKDFDAVMEKFSDRKPTTIKNYMNAIIVVLGALAFSILLFLKQQNISGFFTRLCLHRCRALSCEPSG